VRLSELLLEQFIASFKSAPAELILDFDATDNPLHGQQLLCAYLRESRIDATKRNAAILKLLVRRLRQVWPDVRIVFRGDCGFCRQRIINWCERSGVRYIIGLARNARLSSGASDLCGRQRASARTFGVSSSLRVRFKVMCRYSLPASFPRKRESRRCIEWNHP
jgi:hypothetical protein